MKVKPKRESFYKAKPEIFKRAKSLRNDLTEAEKALWLKLKVNKINGLRFKRQHPIGKFIVDFYCHKALLIIELDGEVHADPEVKERDEGREFELKKLGLTILRFTNKQVIDDIENVVMKIAKVTESYK